MADGTTKPIEDGRAGRASALVLRESAISGAAPVEGHADSSATPRRACESRRRAGREHRQHPRAHPLCGLPATAAHAAALHDVPDAARGQGIPRRDDPDLSGTREVSRSAGFTYERCRSRRTPPGSSPRIDSEARPGGARPLLSLRYGLPTLPFARQQAGNGSPTSREPITALARFRVRQLDRTGCQLLRDRRAQPRASASLPRRATKGRAANRHRDSLRGPPRTRPRCTPWPSVAGTSKPRARARGALASRSGQPSADAPVGATSRASRTTTTAMERRRADSDRDAGAMRQHARLARLGIAQRADERAALHARLLRPTRDGDVRRGRVVTTSWSRSSASSSTVRVYDLDVEGTHNFVAGRPS